MDGQPVEVDRGEVEIPLGDDPVRPEDTLSNGVPNGFDPERLEQLLLQVEELKKEQQQFKEEQEGWNAAIRERDDLQKEVQQLRNLIMKTEEQGQERFMKIKQEYEMRMEKLARERDSMVVNYAKSENQVIVSQNQREAAEKKMRDLAKERDVLLEKIKSLNGEKTKVCSMMEAKCNELFNAQREMEKMKEEINSREIKVRWGQNKLKAECESHKETQTKLEKTQQQVRQLKEELEEVKKACAEMRLREQQSQKENGLNEEQLLEEKAKLIVEKQSMEEQFAAYRNALKEFENLRVRHTQLVGENEELTTKLQSILKERSQQEQEIVRLKEQAAHQRQALMEAQTKLAECEGMQTQLERERDRLSKNQEELQQIRQSNSELEQGIQRCRTKETELLEFTQRLTDKNVQLQSDLTALQEKWKNANVEHSQLSLRLEQTECQLKSLQLQLKEEQEHRTNESAVWAKTVADKSRLCEDLQTQVRELNNEVSSVKRKQTVNIKELTRELRVTKKRLEQMESSAERGSIGGRASGSQQGHGDVVSLGSRTSSNTSINTAGIEASERESPSPTRSSPQAENPPQRAFPATGSGTGGGANEWERNALLEKMIRVQRDNARKSEKIDFLEEHVADLVNELKKKNRLLQTYFIKEDSGVLTNEATDRHKAELAKHAGIMSSMYNQKGMDSELSLDLCLEINRKLQSVLEDTLLKNITLKENLSTLGAEVARITQDYQSLLQHSKQGAAKSK